MKVLITIIFCALSTVAMAQQTRVTPVTVTGGTIEIDDTQLPSIMSEDGMSEDDIKIVTISRIRLSKEEDKILQEKIDELMQKRMSHFYDHSVIDVLD